MNHPVIWIFGRPGSGKTTLSKALAEDWPMLSQFSQQPLVLDSDEVRKMAKDGDFTVDGRVANIDRLILMAQLARPQLPVVVCAVTPYRSLRETILERIPDVRLIYLNCSDALCKERDKPLWYGTKFEAPVLGDRVFCMSAEWPTEEQVKLISKIK
jgi:adenylylsulfate kinase